MTLIVTFIAFALCILLMAVGIIFSKKPLKKGCSLGVDCACKKEGMKPGSEACKTKPELT